MVGVSDRLNGGTTAVGVTGGGGGDRAFALGMFGRQNAGGPVNRGYLRVVPPVSVAVQQEITNVAVGSLFDLTVHQTFGTITAGVRGRQRHGECDPCLVDAV